MGLLGKTLGRPPLGGGGLSYSGIGDQDGISLAPIFTISGLQGLWDISVPESLNGGNPVSSGTPITDVADLTENGNDLTTPETAPIYEEYESTPYIEFTDNTSLFGWNFQNTLGTFFFVSILGPQIIEVDFPHGRMPATGFAAAGFINRAPSTLTPTELSIINDWLAGRFSTYYDGYGYADASYFYVSNYWGAHNYYGINLVDADDTGSTLYIDRPISGPTTEFPPWDSTSYSQVTLDAFEPFDIVIQTPEDLKVLNITQVNLSKVHDLTLVPSLITYENDAFILEGTISELDSVVTGLEVFVVNPQIFSLCGPSPDWWNLSDLIYVAFSGGFHGPILSDSPTVNPNLVYLLLAGLSNTYKWKVTHTTNPPDFTTFAPNLDKGAFRYLDGLEIPIFGELSSLTIQSCTDVSGGLPVVNLKSSSSGSIRYHYITNCTGFTSGGWDDLSGAVGKGTDGLQYVAIGCNRTGVLSIDPNIPETNYVAVNNNLTGFSGAYPELLRQLILTSCNASEATVDAILAAAVATPYVGSGTPVISLDGTNAAPSAAGAANKAILQGLGYTVNTN